MEKKIQINFIVIGDHATGKTSLLNHFFNDGMRRAGDETQPTLGVDYRIKQIYTQRYGTVEFMLRDTSGMEKYNSVVLTQSFYRGAEGVLLVFDVTRRETLDHLVSVWMPRLRAVNTMHPQCRYMIVGNKTDLVAYRQVSHEEALQVAHQHNIDYIELSSLTADCETIREPFMIVAAHLISARICVARDFKRLGESKEENGQCCS